MRQWLRQRKEKQRRARPEVLVIRAEVEFAVTTEHHGSGLYTTTLICPCSRIHAVTHYDKDFNLDMVE